VDDPAYLTMTVAQPILARPELALPGDHIAFTRSGRAFLLRELPPNHGRWLGYLTDGLAEPSSHAFEETLAELTRLTDGPPPAGSHRSARRRIRRQPQAG
jgi:hypothetical protein